MEMKNYGPLKGGLGRGGEGDPAIAQVCQAPTFLGFCNRIYL